MGLFADNYYPYLTEGSPGTGHAGYGHAMRALGHGGHAPGHPVRNKHGQAWRKRKQEDRQLLLKVQDALEQDILMLRFDSLVSRVQSRNQRNHHAGSALVPTFPGIWAATHFLDAGGAADDEERIAEDSAMFSRNPSPNNKKKKRRHGHGLQGRLSCNTSSFLDSRFRVKKSPKYSTSTPINNSPHRPNMRLMRLVIGGQISQPLPHAVRQPNPPSASSVPNRPKHSLSSSADSATAPGSAVFAARDVARIDPVERHIAQMCEFEEKLDTLILTAALRKTNKRMRISR